MKLTTTQITKKFNRKTLFRDLNISLETGDSISVTGKNGSGKSTLLQIIAGIQNPTNGRVEYTYNEEKIPRNELSSFYSYTGPLVNPYNELTAEENILFCSQTPDEEKRAQSLMESFELAESSHKKTGHFSTGMKQRLRLICCFMKEKPVVILDEPGSNLDTSGREILYSHIESIKKDKIIIIATNDAEEMKICSKKMCL